MYIMDEHKVKINGSIIAPTLGFDPDLSRKPIVLLTLGHAMEKLVLNEDLGIT